LIFIPAWYQREVIVAVFFCANISTTKLILRRLESYSGVYKVESFIRTSITINQNWLKREIDKRITRVHGYSGTDAVCCLTAANNISTRITNSHVT
jgi:hypothetical protein